MLHGKKVLVVLPAYEAEKTLETTFDAIPRDVVDDILLVDDGRDGRRVDGRCAQRYGKGG